MKKFLIFSLSMVLGIVVIVAGLIIYVPFVKAVEIHVPDDYSTIQEAIYAAGEGDVVLVSVGTYRENIDFLGKAITVKSINPNDHDIVATTIVDGNQTTDTFAFITGEGSDSFLTGFTLQNAEKAIYCQSSSPTITHCVISNNSDSGIYCSLGSSPAISHCVISNNSHDGISFASSSPTIAYCLISNNFLSGIYCSASSPTIEHCVISNNSNSGIVCLSSSPTIMDCTISNNVSWNGGGIQCRGSSPIIIDCAIIGNSASGYGGGIFASSMAGPLVYSSESYLCKLKITNSVIAQNSANYGGGCAFDGENFFWPIKPPFPKPSLTNCTIADNIASSEGGGIYNLYSCLPILSNCILWGDSPDEISVKKAELPYNVRAANERSLRQKVPMYPSISYSDVQGGYLGLRNINTDPLFVDPNKGNYNLQSNSPCRKRGKHKSPLGASLP